MQTVPYHNLPVKVANEEFGAVEAAAKAEDPDTDSELLAKFWEQVQKEQMLALELTVKALILSADIRTPVFHIVKKYHASAFENEEHFFHYPKVERDKKGKQVIVSRLFESAIPSVATVAATATVAVVPRIVPVPVPAPVPVRKGESKRVSSKKPSPAKKTSSKKPSPAKKTSSKKPSSQKPTPKKRTAPNRQGFLSKLRPVDLGSIPEEREEKEEHKLNQVPPFPARIPRLKLPPLRDISE